MFSTSLHWFGIEIMNITGTVQHDVTEDIVNLISFS
jgi:hypothetical protein